MKSFRPSVFFMACLLLGALACVAPRASAASNDDLSIAKVGETYTDESGRVQGIIPGKLNLVMELDRDYAILSVTLKGKGVAGYVVRPPDGDSAVNLTFGKPNFPQTDEALMKSPGFTHFDTRQVEHAGQSITWRQWSDAQHLYSDTDFFIPVVGGEAGQQQLIHVGVVANFKERRTALEDKLVQTRLVFAELPAQGGPLVDLMRKLPLDPAAWHLTEASGNKLTWVNQAFEVISLQAENDPAVSAAMASESALRSYWRKAAHDGGGGIVSADLAVSKKGQAPYAVLIAKYLLSNMGWRYQGVIIFPHAGRLWRLSTTSQERGVTGMRETTALLALMAGKKQPDKDKITTLFRHDPYDAKYDSDAKYMTSDEARWDRGYADHPLTVCRKTIKEYSTALKSLK